MVPIDTLLKSQESSLLARIKKYREVAREIKKHLERHPNDWGRYQSVFNQEINAIFRDLMLFEQDRFANGDEASVYKLKRMFVNRLRSEFVYGEHIRWSLEKPYGYAGDYKIIDDMYRNDPQTTGFDRLFDNYAQMSPAANAIRNRKQDIKKFIAGVFKARKERSFRVMDLASGPCRDVKELLDEMAPVPGDIAVDCFDQDQGAIDYAKNLLGGYASFVHFYRENAVRIAFKKDAPKEKYDLIFSLGLFDYLDDRIAQRLIAALKKLLKDNGVMFIANFGAKYQNPSFYFLEWVGEWQLIYRNADDFKKIFLSAGFSPEDLRTESEQQGIIHYVIAKNSA
ncbi:MAG: class I SAM-dependent methyltransferase [Candidatus Omnitrophica bacterium]|nr:class I SAM-dependent methyltransferase [Candidatus Omnitrophota bacterium]